MSYKALLFCPEQKTYRTVTQILGELDFEIETCNEPFAAVKKLTAEHFDAIVVDCENEQNATLLFKSSRHSSANRASLSIAVVEGQAGVARAFRIGANLVLTKPINVEQSKGTIRVARGLLRKSDAPKSAASLVGASTFGSAESSIATAEAGSTTARDSAGHGFSSLPSSGFSESEFELEKDPEVRPEATEAALLESMQDPGLDMLRARENQAGTLKPTTSGSDSAESFEAGHPLSPFAAGAAPAQAPQASLEEKKSGLSEMPGSSAVSDPSTSSLSSSEGSRRPLVIAAVILLLAAGAVYLWQKSHVESTPATAPAVNQLQTAPAPVASPASPESSTTTPAQPSPDSTPAPRHSSGSEKSSSATHKPKKTAFAPPSELPERLA